MGMRICPICDTKVNSMNFCPACKKFVKAVEINRDFYLNERRNVDKYNSDNTRLDNYVDTSGNGTYNGEYYRNDGMPEYMTGSTFNKDMYGYSTGKNPEGDMSECHDEFQNKTSSYDMNSHYAKDKDREEKKQKKEKQKRLYKQKNTQNDKKSTIFNCVVTIVCVAAGIVFGALEDKFDNDDYDSDTYEYVTDSSNDKGITDNDYVDDSMFVDDSVNYDYDSDEYGEPAETDVSEDDYYNDSYGIEPGETGEGDYGTYIVLTGEEAREDGTECTMFGHYDNISDFKLSNAIVEVCGYYGITLYTDKEADYAALVSYENGDTYYDYSHSLYSGLGKGITVYSDYNTGSIHSIYGWNNIKGDGEYFNLDILYEAVAEALQDDNMTDNINEEIMDYINDFKEKSYDENSSNYMVEYVGDWSIYVGRGEDYVYFEMYAGN
jgi:hypothetical protein